MEQRVGLNHVSMPAFKQKSFAFFDGGLGNRQCWEQKEQERFH
jgi:hypothetical protein